MVRPYRAIVVLMALSCGAPAVRADFSACSSAAKKDSLDEQIQLYTLCLTKGDVTPEGLGFAFSNRGVAYFRKGEADLALADFDKSIQLDPKFGLAYFNRAQIHLGRRQFELAEENLTATIARPPYRVRSTAYAYRGLLRMSRGSCAEAQQDFERALKARKHPAWIHAAKGWLLATCVDGEMRNGPEAVKAAQKALSIEDHWKFHDALAAAYAEAGRYDESVRELKAAQAKLPADEAGPSARAGLQERLALYEARQPYRQASGDASSGTANAADWLHAFL